jgi:HAD superfamily hydrolase (TIGR01549 family)
MLHALTFDFWGTLYQNANGKNERLRLLGEALARHGESRSKEDLEAVYRHVWTVWQRIWSEEHRSLSVEDWLHEALAFLEADLPQEEIAGLCRPIEEVLLNDGTPRTVPGVGEVLPRLSARYRLGLISDTGLTPGRILRQVMQRDDLLRHFKVLTFSDETGATKPLPQQFTRTLEILETSPEKAAHIGDLPETDLAGARGVGMRSILFLGVSDRQDGIPLADAAFETYDELEELLENLE